VAKKLLTTPKGVAVYPHLTKPDTKFNKDGVFTIKLKTLDPAEGLKLAKAISAAAKQMVEDTKKEKAKEKPGSEKKVKAATLPITKEEDSDGNQTGALLFSFKMTATGKKKDGTAFTREPVIFDAFGKPVKGLKIGGGSIVKVSYELNPYARPSTEEKGTTLAGVALRLNGVQVIKLVEYGANAEYYGFKDESEDDDATPSAPATEGDEPPTPAEPAPEAADEF
jgi:hypothetical protein